MRKIFQILSLLLGVVCGFSSCEMKKELKGEGGDSDTPKGILDLSLTYTPETKAGTDVNIEDFHVSIYDEQGELAVYFDTYTALKAEPQVLLPIGSYKIVGAWGEKREAAFDAPYFEGSKKCEIRKEEVTKSEVLAEIQNVRVNLALSDDFLKNYKDDYSITLTNGKGVLTLNKNEKRTAYFLPGTTLKYTIKATTLAGKEAMLSGILQNESGSVSPGDLFTIKVTSVPEVPDKPTDPDNPDPSDPNQTEISLKVEVTLTTREIEIVVPTTPTTPEEPENPTETIAIVGSGFNIDETQSFTVEGAKSAVLDIALGATSGMEKVVVKIISQELENILKDENPFDLITPSAAMKDILDGIGLLRPSKGEKAFSFKIGPFMQLLGVGEHKFQVTITDKDGKSLTKTLSVKITA